MTYFLIEDGGSLYTVTASALVSVSGSLSAALFQSDGFTDTTGIGPLLQTLTAPTVHAWSATEQPDIQATVEATPEPQNIVTATVNLVTNEITSVSEINISYTGAPLFAVNIDAGGWLKFDGSTWVSAGAADGMPVATLTAITEQQWNDLFTAATTLQVRATLPGAADTLTEFEMVFLTL